MSKNDVFRIKGATNVSYEFDRYSLKEPFVDALLEALSNVPGIYILLSSTTDNSGVEQYELLYCDVTDNLRQSLENLLPSGIVERANNICFSYEPSPLVRCDIMVDILLGNYFIGNEPLN